MNIHKLKLMAAGFCGYQEEAGAGGEGGGGAGGADNSGGSDNNNGGAGGADDQGGDISGILSKFSAEDGTTDINRLAQSYLGMQQQNTKLTTSTAPESYEFSLPDGADKYIGEIKTDSPLFKSLGEWGKKNNISQAEMQELTNMQYTDVISVAQARAQEVQEFEASMGPNWNAVKEGYLKQLGAMNLNHEDAEGMQEIFSELLTVPNGARLVGQLMKNNRDPIIPPQGSNITPKVTEGELMQLKTEEMQLRKQGKTEQADNVAKKFKQGMATMEQQGN